jgi:D-threo-aldose 1-dehydrogenase
MRGEYPTGGVSVTRLGLGTAPLGGLYSHVDDGEAAAVVRRSRELGLGYFDTAPQYGHGTAERRLGAALAGVPRSSFVLSTKVGRLVVERPGGDTGIFADAPPSDVVFDFSFDGVRRSLEASLRRAHLSSVDLTPTRVSTPTRRCARRTRPCTGCGPRA